MIDWEKRGKSEEWARLKEWAYSDSDLTFAEWCYEQGKVEGRETTLAEVTELFNEMRPRLATNISEFADRLEQLKEHNNNNNIKSPCCDCKSDIASCCGCPKYFEWKSHTSNSLKE